MVPKLKFTCITLKYFFRYSRKSCYAIDRVIESNFCESDKKNKDRWWYIYFKTPTYLFACAWHKRKLFVWIRWDTHFNVIYIRHVHGATDSSFDKYMELPASNLPLSSMSLPNFEERIMCLQNNISLNRNNNKPTLLKYKNKTQWKINFYVDFCPYLCCICMASWSGNSLIMHLYTGCSKSIEFLELPCSWRVIFTLFRTILYCSFPNF